MGQRANTKTNTFIPMPKQRKAVELLANPEFTGNISELCREIGVARSTFYKWIDQAEFREHLERTIDRYTDSELSVVWKRLIANCLKGDTQSIKLYFELKGRYKQQVDMQGGIVILAGEDKIAD